MPQQPVRKSGPYQKPRSKTVKKRITKKTEEEKDKRLPRLLNPKVKKHGPRPHKQEYGTSKLEMRFAKNFLDKLGIDYKYQFRMESIGRYLDFYIPECNVAIEVDGDFYHSYGLVYEQMSPMQKKNRRVDEQKNHWCAINGIKLIRIWEHDINEHPESVMKMLKAELESGMHSVEKKRAKSARHNTAKNREDDSKNINTRRRSPSGELQLRKEHNDGGSGVHGNRQIQQDEPSNWKLRGLYEVSRKWLERLCSGSTREEG